MNARQMVYMSSYITNPDNSGYWFTRMTENKNASSLQFEGKGEKYLTIVEFNKTKNGYKEKELQIIFVPKTSKDDDLEKELVKIYNKYLPKTFVNVSHM